MNHDTQPTRTVTDAEIKAHFDYAPLDHKELLVKGAIWMRDKANTPTV